MTRAGQGRTIRATAFFAHSGISSRRSGECPGLNMNRFRDVACLLPFIALSFTGCERSMYQSSRQPAVPAVLRESWKAYVERFVQRDGRVIDYKADGISTSEGQAYAM